jgi:hypothetical protein
VISSSALRLWGAVREYLENGTAGGAPCHRYPA